VALPDGTRVRVGRIRDDDATRVVSWNEATRTGIDYQGQNGQRWLSCPTVRDSVPGLEAGPRESEAHEDMTTSLASIIEERVAASGTPAEPFDLRPQRDVVNRRVWRERVRRMMRIGTLLSGEMVVVAASLGLALFATSGVGRVGYLWLDLLPMIFLLGVGGQAVFRTYGAATERRSYTRSAVGALTAVVGFAFLGLIYPYFQLVLKEYLFLAVFMGSGYAAVRVGVERLIRTIYRNEIGRRPTLIIGEQEAAWSIRVHFIVSDDRQARVIGHLAPDPSKDPTALGGLDSLRDLIEEHDIRSVIVSAHLDADRFRDIVRCCLLHGASVSVVPAELSSIPCKFTGQQVAGWPLIELEIPRMHLLQVVVKRTLDLVVAGAAIVLLAPIGLAITLAIRLDSPGPAIFRQRRLGLGGRSFRLWKYRSMRLDAEEILKADPLLYRRYVESDFKLAPDEDPRVTRVGRFLRRTSLDELPQLFNVLLGDMSLVGPRPVVPDEIGHYGAEARVFLAVKPGLTGDWQVSGRSDVVYPERAQLDIDYINNWGLGRDLSILARTVSAVLERRGAY
jgi:exopolysaccharide biosynthesis polyprenyl glycosylphosphotransferase